MVESNTIINVTNRSGGSVGYTIPDMGNLQRRFADGETKQIPADEIRKLDWTPGGHILIRDYFKLDNEELINELLHGVEPEYFYTEEQVKDLLLNGDMDSFMDCIDFAPNGIIELMKELAVKLEIPDVRKRQAISTKTGVNIDNAIKINQLSQTEDDVKETDTKQRRVQPKGNDAEAPKRRTAATVSNTGKYKIVSK